MTKNRKRENYERISACRRYGRFSDRMVRRTDLCTARRAHRVSHCRRYVSRILQICARLSVRAGRRRRHVARVADGHRALLHAYDKDERV